MQLGEVIADRFDVESLAGEGGMGLVFRAKDRLTGGHVALKVIHGASEDGVERFLREANVLAVLRHPGIVKYVAHGTTPAGEAYLAMEWLEGEELSKRIARQGLTIHETLRLGRRVAEALAVAHERGVVHRDIKPSNIFLRAGDVGQAVVLDFGVARLTETRSGLTRTGAVVGTPGYMSPEQARGERDVDARADVFSFGGVLFKCLTGQAAFAAESVVAQLAKILFNEAPRVRDFRLDVPDEVDEIVARMLAKDPAKRPSDGAALVAEFAKIEHIAELITEDDLGRAPISIRDAQITTGEQRLASVVLAAVDAFVVAGDSTVRDHWNTLDARRQRLRAAALPFGAQVEALANGAVIATLRGRGGAATDQAAHAARCALAMRATAADVPIALATTYGELDSGGVRPSLGEVIDRAAGLLRDARPAETTASSASTGQPSARIRVDDVTAALLDVRFDVSAYERTGIDGRTAGAELRGERGGLDVARTLLGRATSCVGRERELASLRGLFEEVSNEPVARCVLLTGPPGIGKSRVRYEFARALGETDTNAQVWVARGDPMSAGSPFAMLAQALRNGMGLFGGEPLEFAQKKLRSRVAWRTPANDAERVTEFLGELLDVKFDDAKSVQLRAARQDPILMGDQMRRAFEDFVAAECKSSTVVIVLEDLHWGDLPTVKFIDSALRNFSDARLMVFALARPEVHEVFPKLWAERGLQELRIGELTRRAAEKLVREVLGDGVTDEQIRLIVGRAAGNAFYLEEMIRSIAEGRNEALPDTVLAMLQARLESLPAEARRVLRAASVFGEVFWAGGVGALAGAGPQLKEWLGELVGWELTSRRLSSRFPGEEEYVFRHALVREAAYSTLLVEDCSLGHKLAGEWLAKIGETTFATIAEHFERGGKPARARTWYARAAAQALEGNDFLTTLRMAERATSAGGRDTGGAGSATSRSEPTTGSRSTAGHTSVPIAADDLGELRLLAAEAHAWRGEFAEAKGAGLEAMELLSRGSTRWYAAAGEVALAASRLGDYELLSRILAVLRALEKAERVGVPYIVASARAVQHLLGAGEAAVVDEVLDHLEDLARRVADGDVSALAWIAFVRSLRSDPAASMELTEAAIAHFETAGDLRTACMARGNLGDANSQMGYYTEAETLLHDALGSAERMGLQNVAALARVNLGFCIGRLGRTDEALTHIHRGAGEMHAQGDVRREACAWIYASSLQLAAGRTADARKALEQALPIVVSSPPMRAWALGLEAEVMLAEGKAAEARESARQGLSLLEQTGFLDEGESVVRLAWAEALRATGDEAGFLAAIADAKASLLKRAAAIMNERRRASFLENVPENARTMALAG